MKWSEKHETLFRAVGEVGEDLVFFAEVARFPNHFRKWLSTAAALALVIGLTVIALPFLPRGCGSSAPPATEATAENQKETEDKTGAQGPDLGEGAKVPETPDAPAEQETETTLFAYYYKDENNGYISAPLSKEQTAALRELLYNAEWADNALPTMGFPCDYSIDMGEDHIMVMKPNSGWELRSPVLVRCPDKTYDILLSPETLEELYGLLEEIRIQIEKTGTVTGLNGDWNTAQPLAAEDEQRLREIFYSHTWEELERPIESPAICTVALDGDRFTLLARSETEIMEEVTVSSGGKFYRFRLTDEERAEVQEILFTQ